MVVPKWKYSVVHIMKFKSAISPKLVEGGQCSTSHGKVLEAEISPRVQLTGKAPERRNQNMMQVLSRM